CKQARIRHRDLYLPRVVNFSARSERLNGYRLFRVLYVNDKDSIVERSDIGVSASNVNIVRIVSLDETSLDQMRFCRIRYIQHLQPVEIGYESIPELNRDRLRPMKFG